MIQPRSTTASLAALVALAVPAALATGCGEDQASAVPLILELTHAVGGTPLALGTDTPYVNAAGNHFGVTRLSYFLSDVTVTMADGSSVIAHEGHLVDEETAATKRYRLPQPGKAGALASVSLVIGLPPELNGAGAYPQAPESLMEWPEMMGGGYHFMKQEGRFLDAKGAPANFMTHTGGLGGTDYSIPITLDAKGLSIHESGAVIQLTMELAEWYTHPTDWDFNLHTMGVMKDAAAQATLQANGADVFTLRAVTTP